MIALSASTVVQIVDCRVPDVLSMDDDAKERVVMRRTEVRQTLNERSVSINREYSADDEAILQASYQEYQAQIYLLLLGKMKTIDIRQRKNQDDYVGGNVETGIRIPKSLDVDALAICSRLPSETNGNTLADRGANEGQDVRCDKDHQAVNYNPKALVGKDPQV